jgi:hypothetical protein
MSGVTWEAANQRSLHSARQVKMEKAEMLRIDSTVTPAYRSQRIDPVSGDRGRFRQVCFRVGPCVNSSDKFARANSGRI